MTTAANADYIGGPRRANVSSGSLVQSGVATPAPSAPLPRVEDPVRQIGDQVWAIRGGDGENGWVRFHGRVLEVQSGGVRITGSYAGYGNGDGSGGPYLDDREFFVAHFPYAGAENEYLRMDRIYVAREAGTYTYTTVLGGSRTIRKLEYGVPYVPPPPTPAQIEAAQKAAAAARAKAEAAKKAAAEKVLKSNQDAAAAGSSYGLLRMGERYRDGDGVEKDLVKAKDYLQRAAQAGSPTAVEELKKLP